MSEEIDSSKYDKAMEKLSKAVEHRSGGIGFLGALFITFLVLKLTNVISWSWWWVFAPLYPAAFIIGLLVLALVAVVIVGIIALIVGCVKKK